MSLQPVVSNVYMIPLGMVNAFLIDDDGLTLIDTGVSGSAPAIFEAVSELGKQPNDIRHIVLTHLHGDHVGSVRAVKEASGAQVWMHPKDTEEFLKGTSMRPVQVSPGLLYQTVFRAVIKMQKPRPVEATEVEGSLCDGQVLPFGGGLKVVYTPGHTAGSVVMLYPKQGGVLFVGDACAAMFGLSVSPIYEDYNQGLQSLKKISMLDFKTACLSHGKPIVANAREVFLKRWK